ncbi:MAG: hypothetical protein KVP17_002860 [Porospora cf. gigantea B]|uniref:uncharacterized protein n=2 Tax=Porospora cf. gigantea B TaxID=2853592 RepID=UPI0035717FDD|nr:MAG: hypothetical protein KVP17_002860 [Porospora cf. gigantea B]
MSKKVLKSFIRDMLLLSPRYYVESGLYLTLVSLVVIFSATIIAKGLAVTRDDRHRNQFSVLGWRISLPYTTTEGPKQVSLLTTILRPLLLSLAILSETVQAFLLKIRVFFFSIGYVLFSFEQQSLQTTIDAQQQEDLKDFELVETRTIYFIRHAESVWNAAFNRPGFLGRIARTFFLCVGELMLSCQNDSVIVDSPLSTLGITQAQKLNQWVQTGGKIGSSNPPRTVSQAIKVLQGEVDCRLVCSNLRRAMSTLLICMQPAINHCYKKVFMVSDLQEITRNPDGLSLSNAKTVHEPSFFERSLPVLNMTSMYNTSLDPAFNHGNKSIVSNAADRLMNFAEWLFSSCDESGKVPIVVAGHSMVFMRFFQMFVRGEHVATKSKIVNCGVIRFEFRKYANASGRVVYDVEKNSIESIYGSFVDSK